MEGYDTDSNDNNTVLVAVAELHSIAGLINLGPIQVLMYQTTVHHVFAWVS